MMPHLSLLPLRTLLTGTCLALSLGTGAACTPSYLLNRAIDSTLDSAATRVGERVGERVGDAVAGHMLASLTPELMQAYAMGTFQLLFYHGGHQVQLAPYKPGHYTRWQSQGLEQGEMFERALLRREDDGTEWWRVKSTARDENGKSVGLTMEALFSAEDAGGRRQVRRLRALFPDEPQPREIPVTEQNAEQWTIHGQQTFTPESVEGLRQGVQSVTTPAGTFKADWLRYDQPENHTVEWWVVRDASVPGQLVRYRNGWREDAPGEGRQPGYELVLSAYGSDATTSLLGSF